MANQDISGPRPLEQRAKWSLKKKVVVGIAAVAAAAALGGISYKVYNNCTASQERDPTGIIRVEDSHSYLKELFNPFVRYLR